MTKRPSPQERRPLNWRLPAIPGGEASQLPRRHQKASRPAPAALRSPTLDQAAASLLEDLGPLACADGRPVGVVLRAWTPDPRRQCWEICEGPGRAGWVAPRCVLAVGMVAAGRAQALGPAAAGGSGGSAVVSFLVARDGQIGSRVRFGDRRTLSSPPSSGRLYDFLLRNLALPTLAPEADVRLVRLFLWVANLLSAKRLGCVPERLPAGWGPTELERLRPHQPIPLYRAGDLAALAATGGPLEQVRAACEPGELWSWAQLHTLAARGWAEPFVGPPLACWLDEGSFSRELLSLLPSRRCLLEAVEEELGAASAEILGQIG